MDANPNALRKGLEGGMISNLPLVTLEGGDTHRSRSAPPHCSTHSKSHRELVRRQGATITIRSRRVPGHAQYFHALGCRASPAMGNCSENTRSGKPDDEYSKAPRLSGRFFCRLGSPDSPASRGDGGIHGFRIVEPFCDTQGLAKGGDVRHNRNND